MQPDQYLYSASFARIAAMPSEISFRIEIGIPNTQGTSIAKLDLGQYGEQASFPGATQ
jgi:hypothetical protein